MYNKETRTRDRGCRQEEDHRTLPQFRRKSRTPSFSSSLLDSICRSIDHPSDEPPHRLPETEHTVEKQSNGGDRRESDHSLKRAIMIDTWIEKQSAFDPNPCSLFTNSASSSSDSSSGGGTLFSSSETESSYRDKLFTFAKPRVVSGDQKPKQDRDGFTKTKLRALKIYGELKKVKQPISPGGRISSFLNSIFSSGGGGNNGRKAKMCSSAGAADDVNFDCKSKSKSACSSASSFSRSCMNKTGRKLNRDGVVGGGGAKRSVRFYPVSVIVDEDSRPCGHKCIYEDDPSLLPTPLMARKRDAEIKKQSINGGVEELLLMRSYQKKKGMIEFDDEDEDEDEDDAKSCASSDLFELDHLIGKARRYREELPVYETTSLRTNKAIASGFIF